jgi:hypothetical protein
MSHFSHVKLGAIRLTASAARHGRWGRRRRWWWRRHSVCVVASFWWWDRAQLRDIWYGVVDDSSGCKARRVGEGSSECLFRWCVVL